MRPLQAFAFLTAAVGFLLVIAGGLVTSTGSGLAVPDWPLSYGTLFPPMVGGIRFEHSHRVIAATVGLMTLALALWVIFTEQRRCSEKITQSASISVMSPTAAAITRWLCSNRIPPTIGGKRVP